MQNKSEWNQVLDDEAVREHVLSGEEHSQKNENLLWLQATFRALRDSRWTPALDAEGIDVLDALVSQIYTAVLNLSRETEDKAAHGQSAPSIGSRLRVPGFVRERRLPAFAREGRAMLQSLGPEKSPVIFWTKDRTHTQQQLPVAASLAEMGINSRFVVCEMKMFEQLRSGGIPAIYTWGAWPDALRRARRQGRELGRQFDIDPDINLPALSNQLPRARIISALRRCIQTWLPKVHETIAATAAIAQQIAPEALIVGNDITVEGRTACLYAAGKPLPTLCLMHGIAATPLHGIHRADKVLVYGNSSRRFFVEQGLDLSRIVICGSPYLDSMPQQSGHTHPQIRRRLGLEQGKAWVLIATSGPGNKVSPAHHRKVVESLVRLSADVPEIHFVVKLHPKDSQDNYRRAEAELPASRLHIITHREPGLPTNIFDWLQGCSGLITCASTVALEALLMDVPVITIDLADELNDIDFIRAGATSHVKNAEQLERTLRETLQLPQHEPGRQGKISAFLADTFYALDRRASFRSAEVIRSLINGHR